VIISRLTHPFRNASPKKVAIIVAVPCLLVSGFIVLTLNPIKKVALSRANPIAKAIHQVAGAAVLGESTQHTSSDQNQTASPGPNQPSKSAAHGGKTIGGGHLAQSSSSSPLGALQLSANELSVKLSKSAPDVMVHTTNGDDITRFEAIDEKSPTIYYGPRTGTLKNFGQTVDLMINAIDARTAVGTHHLAITATGTRGVYKAELTVHVLPPPAFTLSIWEIYQQAGFAEFDLMVTGDPDYDYSNLNELVIENPPQKFDCSYDPRYVWSETRGDGKGAQLHWRCDAVAGPTTGDYPIKVSVDDRYGVKREIAVELHYDSSAPEQVIYYKGF
jgi:hypothetical protein